jgi:two-component system cell cycle sensor histidine kinase/response regulator CckA
VLAGTGQFYMNKGIQIEMMPPQRLPGPVESSELQKLRSSEIHYRRIFENAKDGILILDFATGKITDVNPFLVEMLAYTRNELLGKELWQIGPFKDIAACRSAFTKLQSEGAISYEDLPLETKDGRSINVEFVSTVYTVDRILVVQCNVRDITERERAVAALKVSETHHRSVFEGAVHGIYRGGMEGQFLAVNPALVNMLGYSSADEVLKLNVAQDVFAFPEEGLRLLRKWQVSGEIDDEVQWKRRDKSLMTARLSGRVLGTEHQKAAGMEVIAEDVTERRVLEGQLRQALKLEAMGQLAGGMAHEFNNYLSIVMGYAELLLEEVGLSQPGRRNVAEIKAATQGAASLTRQLLAVSRQQVMEPKVLDVNAVVLDTQKLLCRLIPRNIALVPVLDPDLLPVKADPAQIQQILINLVVNSRDAMPQGGKVIIETANVELDDKYASHHLDVQPGSYVMLAVSDNGSGIDGPTQARIFEPFFTTKRAGRGTGLGLSTVNGIVRQSGGHITVESALQEGTKFRMYLPPTATIEPKEAEKMLPQPQLLNGTETVLVVEDEPALRRLISETLKRRGYTVLTAQDGTEAMRIIEDRSAPIDLVVSDIMMPKMGGLELKKKAISLRPALKFLLISGCMEGVIGQTENIPQGSIYVGKPFLPVELARQVRTALNQNCPAQTQRHEPESVVERQPESN